MSNPTHLVTFYFGTEGSQQQQWNCSPQGPMAKTFDKKYSIKDLARDIQHDLGATDHSIERL